MADTDDFDKNCNIFISNLPERTDRAVLYEYLRSKSLKVMSVGVKPAGAKCSAYVSCQDHKSAEELIKNMNGTDYKGNKLSFAWVVKDLKKDDKNVVVYGLKKEVTSTELWKEFEAFGKVLSVKVSTGSDGKSNGYGYVRFLLEESCSKVLEEENKKQLASKIGEEKFTIEKYVRKESRKKTNLYVSNISKSVTEDEFVKYFEQFGVLSKPNNHMYISKEQYSTNIGYINFEDPESASKAIKESNNKEVLKSKLLSVVYFLSKEERKLKLSKEKEERNNKLRNEYADFNLYFRREDGEPIDKQEFYKTFADCGEIYAFRIRVDSNRQPTNVCYVCFKSYEAVNKVKKVANDRGYNVSNYKNTAIPNYAFFLNPYYYYNMYYMNNRNYRNNRSNNDNQKKHKQQKPKPVTEEMKTSLGETVYDNISKYDKYDDETVGKVTGILLESYDYNKLSSLSKNDAQLKKVVEDVINKLNENK